MKPRASLFGTTFACALVISRACASNYLQNSGFEQWNPNYNGYASYTGASESPTSSLDWYFYNFTNGVSTSDEVAPPPGLPGSGDYSLLITESRVGNSIFQNIGQVGNPAGVLSVSGWVCLDSGSVGIGLENDSLGQPVVYASTATVGQWINLAVNTGGYATYGFFIVALSPNTVYYADNMDADSNSLTPEPAPVAALGIGTFGLLWRRRRKSCS